MATLFSKGDGIKGERITVECRKHHFGKRPISGTSRHRAQRGRLEGSVYCIIDKPVRSKKEN